MILSINIHFIIKMFTNIIIRLSLLLLTVTVYGINKVAGPKVCLFDFTMKYNWLLLT